MAIPYKRTPVAQLPTDATRPTFAKIGREFMIEADRVLALLTGSFGILSSVVTVIAAGHALLSATHTDTVVAGPTRGALIYGNSTPAWARLSVGPARTFLGSDGTDVSWQVVTAGYASFGIDLAGQTYSP
jgi:hypothetical protein